MGPVQFSSVSQSCPALCDPMNRSTPGLPVYHQLPEFTQTHVHRVSDAIQPSHPLSSPLLLPPIPPSIRVFSNESTFCMRWPRYWSFSFSIILSKEIPGLDLLAVQGTLKSLLQCRSSNASILRCSAFFTDQLSHPYMTTGKTIDLTRLIIVGKIMSLLFNMLFSSVQFSHSVVSDSLRPHESQHSRPPVHPNSWSSLKLMSIESVMPSSHLILCRPLLLCPQSLPASESFPMSQLFA